MPLKKVMFIRVIQDYKRDVYSGNSRLCVLTLYLHNQVPEVAVQANVLKNFCQFNRIFSHDGR